MNRREFFIASAAAGLSTRVLASPTSSRIDRTDLVRRHCPVLNTADIWSPLQVGNGEFGFTADITGLQTFNEDYLKGMPLGTLSNWGWHSFANPQSYHLGDVMRRYNSHGREVPYAEGSESADPSDSSTRMKNASEWLRQNPHRIDLGRIGFILRKANGTNAALNDIKRIHQRLNLLNGQLESSFAFENKPVQVTTVCHPRSSTLAVRIKSPLLLTGRMGVSIGFPYASGAWNNQADWDSAERFQTKFNPSQNGAIFECVLDSTRYWVQACWSGNAFWEKFGLHHFHLFTPRQNELELVFSFSPEQPSSELPQSEQVLSAAEQFWQELWQSGGAIDVSASVDPRAGELERRIVLSQYLTAINCSGSLPPQETGLVADSWYGKFHLEMHWWHAAHFVLWGRSPLLEKSLPWYIRILPRARETARLQGYRGARWPKMVGPDGRETPGSINPFIIWQQPHPIYYAELLYQARPSRETLRRYQEIVHETAEFMGSYAWRDPATRQYSLGPPVVPAQEVYARMRARVVNPTFELAYWQWALAIAQQWRERLGQPREPHWDLVIENLSHPIVRGGVYSAIGVAPYTRQADHPSLLYALGFVPQVPLIRPETMRRTFQNVLAHWNWDSTWGWDYPAMAMTAARLEEPEKAVDVLMMDMPKNQYLANGNCFQRSNLPLYLPANGGLLFATALMAAGWSLAPDRPAPGFPNNGRWNVKHEGLRPAL
jgi:hypothetical protein